MLLEGLVTSRNSQDEWNLAPMGPIVEGDFQRLILRPFTTSTTYRNLKQNPQGVFHITDDVLLIARTALGLWKTDSNRLPERFPATRVNGSVLQDCCRWYEFEVTSLDDSSERTRIEADVVHSGRIRDFIGFHRARHAVIEATILATRLHLIDESEVRHQLKSLAIPVEKTASIKETTAFDLVCQYVDDWYKRTADKPNDSPKSLTEF